MTNKGRVVAAVEGIASDAMPITQDFLELLRELTAKASAKIVLVMKNFLMGTPVIEFHHWKTSLITGDDLDRADDINSLLILLGDKDP